MIAPSGGLASSILGDRIPERDLLPKRKLKIPELFDIGAELSYRIGNGEDPEAVFEALTHSHG